MVRIKTRTTYKTYKQSPFRKVLANFGPFTWISGELKINHWKTKVRHFIFDNQRAPNVYLDDDCHDTSLQYCRQRNILLVFVLFFRNAH